MYCQDDKKWVLYRSENRRRTMCRISELPPSMSKPELHPKKLMLNVWFDVKGIIHWEFLEPNQTINATFYCQ